MKKLDEIMELMSDEMADFKAGLKQLKRLSTELQNQSIPISTEILEEHLAFFLQQQEKREALRIEILQNIEKKLEKAYILPKNIGILLVSLLIILMTIIGYLTYEIIQGKEEKIELHEQTSQH